MKDSQSGDEPSIKLPEPVASYTPPPDQRHKSSKLPLLIILVLLLIGGANAGIYLWQRHVLTPLNKTYAQLTAQKTDLEQQLSSQTDQNNGVVAATKPTQTNTVKLANNQVSFTIPSGWVAATNSKLAAPCYNGWYGSTVTCLDIAVVVPKAINSNPSNATYGGITVSVYKHSDGTSAEDWYVTDLLGGETAEPADVSSTTPINSYSTYYLNQGAETIIYGSQSNNEYYVLANKSYVVVISSNVKNIAGEPASSKVNDNSQYEPTAKALAGTVKIEGN